MSFKMPDPKEIVDSVADGAVEIAEGPVRIASNLATVAQTLASEARANMEDVKARMPNDPSVLPQSVVKAAGQTVKAGLGIFGAFGKGIMDTFAGVQNQIRRVTG